MISTSLLFSIFGNRILTQIEVQKSSGVYLSQRIFWIFNANVHVSWWEEKSSDFL